MKINLRHFPASYKLATYGRRRKYQSAEVVLDQYGRKHDLDTVKTYWIRR